MSSPDPITKKELAAWISDTTNGPNVDIDGGNYHLTAFRSRTQLHRRLARRQAQRDQRGGEGRADSRSIADRIAIPTSRTSLARDRGILGPSSADPEEVSIRRPVQAGR